MLANTDPSLLLFLYLLVALLSGPTFYLLLRLIVHVILWLFPDPVVDEGQQPSNNLELELRPDTHVGCPDGLCYLPLFHKRMRPRVIRQIGHFPSIIALTIVSKSYRRNVRGVLELIGDGVAHFEPDIREGLVWDIIESMMARFDLVGGSQLTRISYLPPDGYSYLQFFITTKRNEILEALGPNPLLQTIININPAYHCVITGVVLEKGTGHLLFERDFSIDGWTQALAWNACHPGVRIG